MESSRRVEETVEKVFIGTPTHLTFPLIPLTGGVKEKCVFVGGGSDGKDATWLQATGVNKLLTNRVEAGPGPRPNLVREKYVRREDGNYHLVTE